MQNNKGHDNLIPISERTEEERKEIAAKGGRAKAEKEKKRKEVAETFRTILALEYDEPCEYHIEQHRGYNGVFDKKDFWIELQGQTLLMRLCAGIVKKAMDGDMRASELILRYLEPCD
jgi:hypothetical protein